MATKAKNESQIFVMKDGRSVTFGKRMKMTKEILRDAELMPIGVRFNFRNGESRSITIADIPEATQEELKAHGTKQKCGDECSDDDNVDDYIVSVETMIDRLLDGVWKADREGGFAGSAMLIAACMEVFGKDRAETRKILSEMKPTERAGMRQEPSVKVVLERLEAASAQGVDLSALAAKFGVVAPTPEEPKAD